MNHILKFIIVFQSFWGYSTLSQDCGPYKAPCEAFINQNRLPVVSPQQTSLWCWAASAQSIFRYYGYEMEQSVIVKQTLGNTYNISATAYMMIMMLNTKYTDRYGRKFRVRTPKIYDGFSWLSANPYLLSNIGATPMNNNDIISALNNGRPLMMGTQTHAVMLTAMSYYKVNEFVSPVSGWILDPYPDYYYPQKAIGLRQLTPDEMTAFFMADVIVYNNW